MVQNPVILSCMPSPNGKTFTQFFQKEVAPPRHQSAQFRLTGLMDSMTFLHVSELIEGLEKPSRIPARFFPGKGR
jgi:hypothetical protein